MSDQRWSQRLYSADRVPGGAQGEAASPCQIWCTACTWGLWRTLGPRQVNLHFYPVPSIYRSLSEALEISFRHLCHLLEAAGKIEDTFPLSDLVLRTSPVLAFPIIPATTYLRVRKIAEAFCSRCWKVWDDCPPPSWSSYLPDPQAGQME